MPDFCSFADISEFSDFPQEQEIIVDDQQIWNIHLDLCIDQEHKLKQVFVYLKEKTEIGPTNLRTLADIVWQMGNLELPKKYYTHLRNELPPDDPLLSIVYDSLGTIASQKGDLDKSLGWYEESRAFKKRKSSENADRLCSRCDSIYVNLQDGSSFNDSLDLKLPAFTNCVVIEVYWKNFLLAICFIYDKNDNLYAKVYHGNEDCTTDDVEHMFTDRFILFNEEKFDCLTLYVGEGADIGGYIKVKDINKYIESFEDYIFEYARDCSRLAIDELQST